jgi:hypothetical protein
MARSLGIPARLASGYAEGTYDEERAVFRIRKDNAHSWPEVYFPGYGWVEFEPTVSEAPLNRPEPDPEAASQPPEPPETDDDLTGGLRGDLDRNLPVPEDGFAPVPAQEAPANETSVWPWVAILLIVVLIAAGRWGLENVGVRRLPAAEQAYARLLRFGRWLGRPLRGADTPLEWGRKVSAIVPEAEEPITQIVALYLHAQFGQGDTRDPAANLSWNEARPLLWRHLLWRRWLVRLGLVPARTDPEN